MTALRYTETVAVVRSLGTDRFGDPLGDAPDRPVPGCVVWPRGSTEQTFGQDTVVVGYSALVPPGTDITATDRVRLRGALYDVEGEPSVFRSPFTGRDPGVLVALRRATG